MFQKPCNYTGAQPQERHFFACSERNKRREWWSCPNEDFAALMRAKGVCSKAIFNCNGGFFIVHHDVIETFYDLAFDCYTFCNEKGVRFVDEPLLSYAMHLLCGNPYVHTIRANLDVWGSDWTGCYRDGLPDGRPWTTWIISPRNGWK